MSAFFLRKIVAGLLYPPTLCLLLAGIGLLLVACGKFTRLGMILVASGVIGLFLLSIPALQQPVIRAFDSDPLSAELLETPTAIVVLGSGVYSWDSSTPPSGKLTAISLARAMEGIRLAKQYPDLPLIFTGGTIGKRPASSAAMAELAIELGIPPDRITTFNSPTSTAEEAKRTAQEIPAGPILLVSSALHLPRSASLFASNGFTPIQAPTDFLVDDSAPDLLDFIPSSHAWSNWQRLFHELYGRAWARLTGN